MPFSQLATSANHPFLQTQFFHNSLSAYFLAFFSFILLYLAAKVFTTIIITRIHKLSRIAPVHTQLIIKLIRSIPAWYYYFLALFVSLQLLHLNTRIDQILSALLIVLTTYQALNISLIAIDYFAQIIIQKDDSLTNAITALKLSVKILLWSLGLLLVLSNLGFDITSLLAGLGIGGIAVALALQNILSDLFSSFALYFDKPFTKGDFIIVDGQLGTVEKIGIKTTRIRALQGEEIVIPNQNLTSTNIQNFKKMSKRRITFSFGVTYETPLSKLKLIPELVENIISSINQTEFDRAHFASFGDSALIYEVVYYVSTGDYNQYMDTQQQINFNILKQLTAHKVSIAYPTQTLHIKSK